MKKLRLWAQIQRGTGILVMTVCLGLSAAMPAGAQETQLPTSMYPPIGKAWDKMRDGSFEPSPESVRLESDYAVNQLETDRLEPEHAATFEEMIANDQCETVYPNGVVHDYVVYKLPNGSMYVQPSVLVALGEDVTALQCYLGDSVYGYFYTGTPEHCNNVAFTFAPLHEPEVASVKTESQENCRFVKREIVHSPGSFVHLPDFNYCGCYIPGITAMVPGSIQTSSQKVCR